jgi:DNA-binding response OmpR family regulator
VKILIVEDSERLRRSLQAGLQRSGFAVDVAADGDEGLAAASLGGYDAIVLDLMLPKLDGLTLLDRVRQARSDVHVLVLSAKDLVSERVEAFEHGADDYLVKPFEFDELVARLRALMRRRYGPKTPVHSIGPLKVDTAKRMVSVDGREVRLTRVEFSVLEYLLARRGSVVSKQELIEHLYADGGKGSENAVEVFVHQLRRKFAEGGAPDVLETRRGHGYVIA